MADNDELSVDELDEVAGGLGDTIIINSRAGCGGDLNTVAGCGSSSQTVLAPSTQT